LFPAGFSVISPDDATILKPASFVIVSAVSTNPSIVKSVVASIVVPTIVPAATAPIAEKSPAT
jgi:hypothetical protein